MNKLEYAGLDQVLYQETLDNGMTVYLVPYKNKNSYCMHYVSKYGSIDTVFTPVGEDKEITTPEGVAHFLEHKKFETEEGLDPFTFSSASGTSCNASTFYKYTRYMFEGCNAFRENLDYLLTFVHTPYFTDENIEKEKGIVIEELMQYNDMADVKIEYFAKEGLLVEHPMRNDIGGTPETVNSITKEDLEKIYKTFYQPSNMFLVITGNFDENEAIEIIKNNKKLNEAPTKNEIIKKEYQEPKYVNIKEREIKFNTNTTKMAYSVKIDISSYDDEYIVDLYFSMMLSMIFGMSSKFREEAKKDGLYTSFYYQKEIIKDYILIHFFTDTEKPEELAKKIDDEFKKMNLIKEEMERIKKVWISSEVLMIDNIGATLDNIIGDIVDYGEVKLEKVPTYKKLNFEELENIMKNTDFTNTSKIVLRPNNEN